MSKAGYSDVVAKAGAARCVSMEGRASWLRAIEAALGGVDEEAARYDGGRGGGGGGGDGSGSWVGGDCSGKRFRGRDASEGGAGAIVVSRVRVRLPLVPLRRSEVETNWLFRRVWNAGGAGVPSSWPLGPLKAWA